MEMLQKYGTITETVWNCYRNNTEPLDRNYMKPFQKHHETISETVRKRYRNGLETLWKRYRNGLEPLQK